MVDREPLRIAMNKANNAGGSSYDKIDAVLAAIIAQDHVIMPKEAIEGVLHFSDTVEYRNDTLAVSLRQWLAELRFQYATAARAMIEAEKEG